MNNAIFYHAGCPVCVSAEQALLAALDQQRLNLKVVHLGEEPTEIPVAELAGVKSVPALLLNGQVLHINFGASLEDLKGAQ